ncbi:MAG: hypothetical protein GXO24_03880, partial [Chlorobi bacterium]|nr:hypothetical protein [Chlorobiota bacterium]
MKVERYIARRYWRSKGGEGFQTVHYITAIASTGILLTVAALFIILSAFSGLRSFNLSLIEKTDPDLRILPAKGKYLGFNDSLTAIIRQTPGLDAYAPVVEEKALLRYRGKQTIVWVRGVDSSYTHILPPRNVSFRGEWPLEGQTMAAGQTLAYRLGLTPGDAEYP